MWLKSLAWSLVVNVINLLASSFVIARVYVPKLGAESLNFVFDCADVNNGTV